jgi:hypothetical protein
VAVLWCGGYRGESVEGESGQVTEQGRTDTKGGRVCEREHQFSSEKN